ncbi:hypothetical protein V2G26_017876 [Clonostachys chloroleuca]
MTRLRSAILGKLYLLNRRRCFRFSFAFYFYVSFFLLLILFFPNSSALGSSEERRYKRERWEEETGKGPKEEYAQLSKSTKTTFSRDIPRTCTSESRPQPAEAAVCVPRVTKQRIPFKEVPWRRTLEKGRITIVVVSIPASKDNPSAALGNPQLWIVGRMRRTSKSAAEAAGERLFRCWGYPHADVPMVHTCFWGN